MYAISDYSDQDSEDEGDIEEDVELGDIDEKGDFDIGVPDFGKHKSYKISIQHFELNSKTSLI